MSQTQKSLAPVAAGCEAQSQSNHPNYTAIAQKVNGSRRLRRAVSALVQGPVSRRDLDSIIGTTNAPEYVRQLNGLGLSVECERVKTRDQDGAPCRYGRYHLAKADREVLRCLLVKGGRS